MTKRVLAIVAVSILTAVAATPLAAQALRLTANIPFEFVVAGKSLPAGEYEIWRSPSASMIVLRGIDHQISALSLATGEPVESNNRAAEARLVFNRYGDRYFLHEVVNPHGAVAFTLRETQVEREMAKTATLRAEQVFAVLARR